MSTPALPPTSKRSWTAATQEPPLSQQQCKVAPKAEPAPPAVAQDQFVRGLALSPQAAKAVGGQPPLNYGKHASPLDDAGTTKVRDLLAATGETGARINSTARSPQAQSRAMYANLEKPNGVQKQLSLYGKAGDKVIAVYQQGKQDGLSKAEIQKAMADKIREVGPARVSNHCADNGVTVVDIDPASIQDKATFKTAVEQLQKDGKVTEFFHPDNSRDPAFHIAFSR